MIKHPLIRHPGTPCAAITSIQIEARRPGPGLLALRYRLLGDIARLWLPDHAVVAERQDFLWKRTCMEVFIQTPGRQSYTEFNLSPSTHWAAYSFSDYRVSLDPPTVAVPTIITTAAPDVFELRADLDLGALEARDAPWRLSLTTVVEESHGAVSYWALKHAMGKPEFHDAATFVLDLALETT